MSRLRSLSFIVALLMSATSLLAVTPNSISYQGRATDAFDVPLNGVQMMTFTITDAPVLGLSLWSSGAQAITCTDGLFTVELGAAPMPALPSTIFDDTVRYLAVNVNGQSITPRTKLISVPFARRVAGLEGAAGGAVSGNVDLQVSGTTRIDLETSGSRVSTYSSSGNERARIWGPSWGELLLYDGSIANENTVELDASTGSVFLRDAGGITTISLNGETTGDGSTVLPISAINQTELSNEPGVASNFDASTALGGGGTNITIRTITAPDDGWIIAFGSGSIDFLTHFTGTLSQARISISENSGVMDANTEVRGYISSNAITGNYAIPMSTTALFPVTAGVHTFYLVGAGSSTAGVTAQNSRLVLLYVPTSYGTIVTSPALKPLTEGEEKAEAVEQNNRRLATEVEQLRAQMANIEAQLQRQQAETTSDNK